MGCLSFTSLCLQIKAIKTEEVSYIVKGEGLHGLVLLQGVHFVQVTVSDEHSSVLRPMETVNLANTKLNFRHSIQTLVTLAVCGGWLISKSSHLADVAGEQNPHEFVFPLQLTGN